MSRLARAATVAVALATAAGCRSERRNHGECEAAKKSPPSGKIANAEAAFAHARELRIAGLHGQLMEIATEPTLIASLAVRIDTTDAGRATINDKLREFQMRLDEASNVVESLRTARPDVWNDRDLAVDAAMERLEQARKDAWVAVEHAPRVAQPAS